MLNNLDDIPLFREENNKKKSKKQEQSLAENILGSRRPASGAFKGQKGDVSSGLPQIFDDEGQPVYKPFLIECKFTNDRSMSVKLDWIRKIEEEAASENKTPAINLLWQPKNELKSDFGYCNDWVAIPREVFERIFKK